MLNKIIDIVKSEKFIKLVKFGCIGVLNTAVDYLSFSACFYWLSLDKFSSQVLAVLLAATNSYLLNNNITFKKDKQTSLKAYLKFMSINLTSVGVSLALMYLFSNVLELEPIMAKIPISIITICLSFTVYDKWVFRKKK